MKLTEVIKTLRTSLETYLTANLSDYSQTEEAYPFTVETYRLDSQEMEQTNRYGARVAIYDGGDNVSASIPGMAQFRGDRVQWGFPTTTVQIIRVDLAFHIAERGQDGWNEMELVGLKDCVFDWVKEYGQDCITETDGGISAFVWGSSNGTTRLRKYAYTTLTLYCMYSP